MLVKVKIQFFTRFDICKLFRSCDQILEVKPNLVWTWFQMQAVFHPVFYQVWFQAGLPFFTRFDICNFEYLKIKKVVN